ncbi:PAS modulated two component system response regulator [Desulfosarcina variabilis str. Montpellier]|uniref:PAS domain-containing response regulator n=1 Tax=Desulfosarcina variabilis TaxID=2300 RepID=UPI003AFAE725
MHQLTDSKILVVEDDPNMCESIQSLLNANGFDVQTSTTLPDALNALQNGHFDLILLDLKLDDQCGFTLIDQLVDRQMDTRVIVVTGQHSETHAITALKKGATDYLKKPFDPNVLIASVNTVLKRQWHQRELELFKHAVGASSTAIVVGDSDGNIVYTNGAYGKLIGVNNGGSGHSADVAFNIEGHAATDEQIRKVVETGMPWNGKAELVDPNGQSVVVCKRVDPIPEPIGGTAYGVALMCDMTAQREKEYTLSNSRERYRRIIDSQQDFLYRLNSKLLITFVNQTFASTQATPLRSMIGMPITAFIQESIQPRLLNAFEAIRSGRAPIELEFEVVDKNGITCWQQWRFEAIRDEDGDLTEFQAVGRDISARKRAEKKLQEESEKLKQALAKVKRLSGMLPICASCKKIRDDSGYWNQIEEYIQSNSDAAFSHGLCPECARKLYPELYKKG